MMTDEEYNKKFEEMSRLGEIRLGDLTEEQFNRHMELASELLHELYLRCKEHKDEQE